MLSKLQTFARQYEMFAPGDHVVCAVSGGADSMALLWAMYLLADKLEIRISAAHFNHHLRGEESDRDEAFVRDFCARYQIPVYLGQGQVTAGEKGLEAAAREARYAFLNALPGKIATAHTANDNAETVLMRLIRGTGLKGLGAIAPVGRNLIRPMLTMTRQEVLEFLEAYHIPFVEDGSNETDAFLRNRIRHHVMPLLEQENPRLAENLSIMALGLREDEAALSSLTEAGPELDAAALRRMNPAIRSRTLRQALENWGVREPEKRHVALAEELVFSDDPSAQASFPGGVTVCRSYGKLLRLPEAQALQTRLLPCPGTVELPEAGFRVTCEFTETLVNRPDAFTVSAKGDIFLRARKAGDEICLSGGTKTLKKLFIDRKIPAFLRPLVPVAVDDNGVLGVYGIGADRNRAAPGVLIRFERLKTSGMLSEK